MAVGTPVVTTNIPGNRDLAEDDKTALLVEWNDVDAIQRSIKSILEDTGLAERLSEGGRRRAAEFRPERTFTETCRAIGIEI